MRTIALVDGYLTFLQNNCLVAWVPDPARAEYRLECINRWTQEGLVPSYARFPGGKEIEE